MNDPSLKSRDDKLLNDYRNVSSRPLDDLRSPAAYAEYKKASDALSRSPRGSLIVYFHTLPLARQYALAKGNSEFEALFLQSLKQKDSTQAISNQNVLSIEEKSAFPHPTVAILKLSKKGGGSMGSTKLAQELQRYCSRQLVDYVDSKAAHLGRINAEGVMLALFKPRKAYRRVKDAVEELKSTRSKVLLTELVNHKDVEQFLDKHHVKKTLSRLAKVK
jgi:hypothetical protein